MPYTHKSLLIALLLPILSFAQKNYTNFVNPFIGTGGHGHTFPGPVVPFGMVQVGPDTRIDGSWDGCSGYHYSDSTIFGFSHTHLSGTGCSDYGDIMLMPMAGKGDFDKQKYSSKFSHQNEIAKAGYYKVSLDDDQIDVELTASTRVGYHRYTFNKAGIYSVVLDLNHRDKLLDGKINVLNGHSINGFRRSYAWAENQLVYYKIDFSKDFISRTIQQQSDTNNFTKSEAAIFTFKVKKGESIEVKVAISQVDEAGAEKNMLAELPDWNFMATRTAAEICWNKELSKIEVQGATNEQNTIFYTALYHCFIHPSIANDADGRYLGRDFKIHQTDGFNYYTVFSLWDTFRALHPLFNIVQRERNVDFIKTFLAQYQQIGRMPMWELSSNETNCMIAYHSVSVIADAMAKGNTNFNKSLAVEASEKTVAYPKFGEPMFESKGYLSVEDEHESVSKTLEYAYNHWCLRQIYQMCNDTNQYQGVLHETLFETKNWQNIFNPKTGFMQPRMNGGWYEPFNPKEVNNNYTEANAWQYTFFVPQDISGLIDAMGGPLAFEKKLDELFETESATTGRIQADISGLIGQYAHGNEPSHHMAYLYNYIGKPHKTQARVQQILKEMYHNAPDGLAGNEDCGQMSAWYVFSAMGLYPVTPGTENYQIGSPIFSKVNINASGQQVSINYTNKSENTPFVNTTADVIQNEPGFGINHFTLFPNEVSSLTKTINFSCSEKPFAEPKFSYEIDSNNAGLLPSPIIQAASRTFNDSLLITLYPNFNNQETRDKSKIYYSVLSNISNPMAIQVYKKPFYIKNSCHVAAYSEIDLGENKMSLISNGRFYKRDNNWSIQLNSTYNKQYTAGGAEGLIDGINGEIDWRKGGWQGYQSQNFEAVLKFKKTETIHNCYGNFIQDQGAWIMMPQKVEFYSSMDGITYTLIGSATHQIPAEKEKGIIQKINLQLNNPIQAKYIKIRAINYGKLPSWHLSAGEDAYIFVDEIGVD